MEDKECLDLADDLAAGTIGVKDLVEESDKGPSDGEDSFSAVGPLVALGQQFAEQEGT